MNGNQTENLKPNAKAVATVGVRPRKWMEEIGVGKNGLAILIRDHGHPAPIQLGNRSSMFLREELDTWLEARKAERDAA